MVALAPYAIMIILPIIIALVSILGMIVNKVVIAHLGSQTRPWRGSHTMRPSEDGSQPPSPDLRREPESRDSSPSIRRSMMSGKSTPAESSTRHSMTSFEKASLEVFEKEGANAPDKSWRAKIFAFLQGLPLCHSNPSTN